MGEEQLWNERYSQLDVSGRATGAAAMDETVAPGCDFMFLGFTLHLDAAPTTAEAFTVTMDAEEGAAYDTVIYSKSTLVGITDIVEIFEKPIPMVAGDELDFAFTNTDTATWGLTPIIRRCV